MESKNASEFFSKDAMIHRLLDKIWDMSLELNRLLNELSSRDIEENTMNEHFHSALYNQRNITQTIINELNWFQRRRLRKKLSYYPNKVCGYNMTKDI